jgi:hypothetical protein
VPMNSERTRGDLLVLSWQRVNSIEVVFMPSRREVMSARSATERSPKYSSRSMAWWLYISGRMGRGQGRGEDGGAVGGGQGSIEW